MRSEGWSVCVCVYVCVCARVSVSLFSHYTLRGGLRAIPNASVLQAHENYNAVFTAFERYAVKTTRDPICSLCVPWGLRKSQRMARLSHAIYYSN